MQLGLQASDIDPTAKRGRRAYVCITRACLTGLHGKAAGKAFKGAVEVEAPEAWQTQLHALAQGRVLELVGLARRQGELLCGVERITSELPEDLGITLKACDAAGRSERRLPQAQSFVAAEVLGHAAGTAPVAAIGIRPGRLAMQAAYWLRVWYETLSRDEQPAAGAAGPQAAGGYQQNGSGHGTPDSRLIEVA
jgi:hypothetical protein